MCWSHLMFAYTLPNAAAFMASSSSAKREDGMVHLKQLIKVTLKAVKFSASNPAVSQMVDDMGWFNQALAQEVIMECIRSNYDSDDVELRRLMMRACSSTSSTKDILESNFNFLQDIVNRQSKNKKSSGHSLWFYSLCSPYSAESVCGMPPMAWTSRDWRTARVFYANFSNSHWKTFSNAFRIDSAQLPRGDDLQFPKSRAGIAAKQMRNSGPLAHYHASAAAAFLIADTDSDFVNAGLAWTGLVFKGFARLI